MKLDYDCARDILKFVENQPLQAYISFNSVVNSLSTYAEDTIYYACLKLQEANYLILHVEKYQDEPLPTIHSIKEITFEGHEFIGNTQNDDNWETIKKTAAAVGTSSLKGLSTIAIDLITKLISNQMGLS